MTVANLREYLENNSIEVEPLRCELAEFICHGLDIDMVEIGL